MKGGQPHALEAHMKTAVLSKEISSPVCYAFPHGPFLSGGSGLCVCLHIATSCHLPWALLLVMTLAALLQWGKGSAYSSCIDYSFHKGIHSHYFNICLLKRRGTQHSTWGVSVEKLVRSFWNHAKVQVCVCCASIRNSNVKNAHLNSGDF